MKAKLLSKIYKNFIFKSFIIGLLISSAYTLWISHFKIIRIPSLKLFDTLLSINYRLQPPDENLDKIIIVKVDDESFRKMNLRWPWRRSVFAGLVQKISSYNPALLCIDFVFIGESVEPEEDLILAKVLGETKNVTTAAYFGKDGKYVFPVKIITSNISAFGFINRPRDLDGYYVRRTRPYVLSTNGNLIDYSLFIKNVSLLYNAKPQEIARHIPVMSDNTAYIYFAAKESDFKSVSAWEIFENDIDPGLFRNNLVFIGTTSEVAHDTRNTPLGIMSGVYMLANETLSVISGNFFSYTDSFVNFIILFLFAFITLLYVFKRSVLFGIAMSAIEIVSFFALSIFLFASKIIIDFYGPIFIVLLISVSIYGSKYIIVVTENMLLRRQVLLDGLTKLYVYRYFELYLKRAFGQSVRGQTRLVVAIYDIDHFKRVNDTYGHDFGNKVLIRVARILKDCSRRNDIVARYGGEEFCVLARDITAHDVQRYAERVRSKINDEKFITPKGESVNVTISAGLATTENNSFKNPTELINAADNALYQSKALGRNRVTLYKGN